MLKTDGMENKSMSPPNSPPSKSKAEAAAAAKAPPAAVAVVDVRQREVKGK